MPWKKKALYITRDYTLAWAASFLYTAGLTSLIPLFLLSLFLRKLPQAFFVATLTALVLIALSFVLCYFATRSAERMLYYMGLFSLFPVLIALMLNVFSAELLIATVEAFVPQFELIEPLLYQYLDAKVPRLNWLIYGYAALGIVFVIISHLIKHVKKKRRT